MTNNFIDLQIEQIQNKKLLKQINHQNVTKIADLTTEKKLIETALKNKGSTTRYLIYGDFKLEFIEKLNKIKVKIKELKDLKKGKELLISSTKQCIKYEEDRIKVYMNKNWKDMTV